jgi:hypothetical protein
LHGADLPTPPETVPTAGGDLAAIILAS